MFIRQVFAIPETRGHKHYDDYPLCFVQAVSFQVEAQEDETENAVSSVIRQERKCSNFTPWQQGFTPKEHREMLDRKQLLEWQVEREREDKIFRKQESQSNRRYRIAELVLVIFTIIAILATAFIGRGEPTINIITPNPPGVTIEK